MGDIIKKETVDGFAGYEDGVEGHDRPEGAGLIQGMKLAFTNSAAWVDRDEAELPAGLKLIPVDIVRAVQKWKDGKPEKTIILEPGQKFPDVEAMNAEVPQSEWVEGPDGKPRGPWQSQHFLYLLDPATMDKYTFPTGTVGGRIAICELRDKLVWMRRNRGSNVYAVVTLTDRHMKTRFGGRPRPHFQIVEWTRLGEGEGSDLQALPAPSAPSGTAATLVPVSEPTTEEDFNDELPGDLAAPKSAPVKTSATAAPSRKRTSTLEAG